MLSSDVEAYRPLLFDCVYMLGSATDAEDVAQEAFVRHAAVTTRDGEDAVRSPKALLTTNAGCLRPSAGHRAMRTATDPRCLAQIVVS